MIPAQAIAGARVLLNDPDDGGPRWSTAILLGYFNDGMKVLAKKRGDLFQEVEQVTLVEGELQTINRTTAFGLVDILKNSLGGTVREVDALSMSMQDTTWRKSSKAVPTQWARLNADPFRFYVYPPAKAADKLTALVVRVPADIAAGAINDDNGVADAYRAAAENYIAGRALTMNTNAADTAKGAGLLQLAESMSEKPTV